ncbi:Ankyrin repeat-containing protein [Rutstroemia sp. NJR-2017a WRK4]|nr:Ankyrin repeat-containing protein [Rutstroemia sp. NJR-2017a WRK4]
MTITAMHMTGRLPCTIVVCTYTTTSCAARLTASLLPWYITEVAPTHPSSTASTSFPFPGCDFDDTMSFGWSAGDIAQAITVIVKVVKTLDDAEGAPADYRKAITFLEGVERTLHQLQLFTKLGKYPAYGDEIRRNVERIKGPLDKFLAVIHKYEPSLGRTAPPGRCHNMYKKLRWEYSNAPKALQKEIKDNLEELNRLLAGFTLDVVVQVQQKQDGLPDDLRQEFANLTSIIGQHVLTIRADFQANYSERTQNHSQVLSALERYHRITSVEHLQPMQNEIKALHFEGKENHLQLNEKLDQLSTAIQGTTKTTAVIEPRTGIEEPEEVLSKDGTAENSTIAHTNHDIGALGKDILAPSDQPSRALVSTLLATYNITFQDALGRHPRVLPFDSFSSFKVFQAFLDDSFATIPGRRWVELGSFLLTNASAGKRLTADNWSTSISRGCLINMDMLMLAHKKPQEGGKCVIKGCTGSLRGDDTSGTSTKTFVVTPDMLDETMKDRPSIGPNVKKNAAETSKLLLEDDLNNFHRFAQRSLPPPASEVGPKNKVVMATTEVDVENVKETMPVDNPESVFDNDTNDILEDASKVFPREITDDDFSYITKDELLAPASKVKYSHAPRPKGHYVWTWSCCYCRDINGQYRSSGLTTNIEFCPECGHQRCASCHVEQVKMRGNGY